MFVILEIKLIVETLISGNNDHVRCFNCGIGLQNWDSEDNPFVEHARWSQECEFLKDKKGLDFIATVQDAVRRVQLVINFKYCHPCFLCLSFYIVFCMLVNTMFLC